MKTKKTFQLVAVVCAAVSVSSCLPKPDSFVPKDWYLLPEDESGAPKSGKADEKKVGKTFQKFLETNQKALEEADERLAAQAGPVASPAGKPADWVPWHLEYFMTDLSVSASGILGGLLFKGTPSLSLIWRKQNPAPQPQGWSPEPSSADLVLNAETTEEQIKAQLEPVVRTAMGTGRVKDEKALRENLNSFVHSFQELTSGLETGYADSEWWPSRFRFDVAIEASGAVTPTISVGGELKVRFEWHRLMRKDGFTPSRPALARSQASEEFNGFVRTVAHDLAAIADEEGKVKASGFRAHSFRVGIGLTNTGQFGVAKTSTTTIAQVYFARKATKPVVNPKPEQFGEKSFPLISDVVNDEHLKLASAEGVSYQLIQPFADGQKEQVVYKVDHDKFRSSLKKATGISFFFAGHANKAKKGKWKIYELKSGFDISITGKAGLSWATGTGTTEIAFYNQSF